MQDDRRVVVIGSGPPGATAAMILTEAGIDVTLLEAGSERAAAGLTLRIGGITVAKKSRPLETRTEGVSGAALFEDMSPGGLTNHWSCAVPRFSPDDFADGARAGERYTWPIGYDDLAPWYDRVEPTLHIAGSGVDYPHLPGGKVRHRWALRKSWSTLMTEGQKAKRTVAPMPYAYGADTTITPSGNVFNSFVRIVKPALRTGRLKVRCGALAVRLELDEDKNRVSAVVFRDTKNGALERVPCAAVVVAAGAVNTAKLLLESTCGQYPAGLGNTHDVLGRYMHDHPLAKLMVDISEPIAMHPPAYIARKPLDDSLPLYAVGCMQWWGAALLAESVLRRHPGRLTWAGFSVFGTMAPRPEDRVRLDPGTRRADGTAGIVLEVRHPRESGDALAQARDQVVELMQRARLSPSVRVWHVETVGDSKHFGGTCRMHASPQHGMLDAWSRLHAVKNVVVADSSAFTTGPEKNPVLTAMALSARASDRLARDLRSGAL